jgi:hypothetical protein
LISRQEHEVWEVLLACQGQLRLGPSGHLVGIDMSAALKIAASRGCNLTVLSELLPAAEAGLVEALRAAGSRQVVLAHAPDPILDQAEVRLGRPSKDGDVTAS